ncbi:hypothetical protein DLE01_30980, partial [Streptomyces sp. FT05W]
FLTFGFMPTTATLEMTQIPPATNPDGTRVPNIKSDLAINVAEAPSAPLRWPGPPSPPRTFRRRPR